MAKTDVDDLKAQIEAMQQTIATLVAMKTPGEQAIQLMNERTAPVNNPHYVERSVFTRPDGSRAVLTRETFFCGNRCRADELTVNEIEAFNAITASKVVPKHNGQWTAKIVQNGTETELHVDVPSKTADDRTGLPGLLLILREIQGGSAAVDPLALAQRVAKLEADNQEMVELLTAVTANV